MAGELAGHRLSAIRSQAARIPARARLPFVRPEALGMVFEFALSLHPQGNILYGAAASFCSLVNTFGQESQNIGANGPKTNEEETGARQASADRGCTSRPNTEGRKQIS